MIRSGFDVRMCHGDESRVAFSGCQGERETLWVGAIDADTIESLVSVPKKRNVVLPRPFGSPSAGPHQQITSVGCVDNLKISAAGGADDDHIVDCGVRGEGMCSSDSDVPRDEDAHPHEGSTGFQTSDGASFEFLRNAAASATTAAAITSGESRFTGGSLSPNRV